jgi:hypothetical protein
LADWQGHLTAGGATAKHVRQTVANTRRVLDGCGFVFITDLSASAVLRFLAELRNRRPVLPALDAAKSEYTRSQAAVAVGVKTCVVTALVRRHRLAATGNGKAGGIRGRRWMRSVPCAVAGGALRPATCTLTL